MPSFIALDVETANPDLASICQIGLAIFKNGILADTWMSYVNPMDCFSPMNKSIHGIDEKTVTGAPAFPEALRMIHEKLENEIVAHYTYFDCCSISRAVEKFRLDEPIINWLDVSLVVRHTWPEKYARDGYGLACVATDMNIVFRHHNAVEDARAAGLILINAINKSGIPIEKWVDKAYDNIDITADKTPPPTVKRKGNINGHLCGETIVFTGSLSVPRLQAAHFAAQAGCDVENNVTLKTTILVVGDIDAKLKASDNDLKTTKHRRAEELIKQGKLIRIIRESDFLKLVEAL